MGASNSQQQVWPYGAALLRQVVDRSSDLILVFDEMGRVTFYNAACRQRLAVSEDELEGPALLDTPDDVARLRALVRAVFEGETPAPILLALRSREGSPLPVQAALHPITEAGEVVACLLVGTDQSDEQAEHRFARRMQAQNEVFARLARQMTEAWGDPAAFLRHVTEEIAHAFGVERVGIWLADDALEQIECLNSFSRAEARHTHGSTLYRSDIPHYFDALKEERVIVAHNAESDPRTFELKPEYLRKHGITSLLDAPIRVGDRMIGVVCHEHIGPQRRWTLEDQSFAAATADFVALALETIRRTDAENALRVHEQFLSRILDTSPNAIFVKDSEGRFVVVNQRFAELYDRTPEEIVGLRHADFNDDPDEVARFAQYDARVLASSQPLLLPDDATLSRRTGQQHWFQTRLIPLRDARDHTFVLGIANDITERWTYEQALKEEKSRAEAALRFQSALLHNMHHEFRTPLTAILGFSELLKEPGELAPDEVSEHAADIHDNGERLLATLNAILDLAQLESGSLKMPVEHVDVAAEVRRVADSFRVQATQRQIALHCEQPKGPVFAHVNREAIERIARNLLSNAFKFTPQGRVTVEVADRGAAVALRVSDTGIGIGEAFLPHATEPFRQESEGLARSHQGSGLGLTIVQQLVALLGGRLDIESAPGRGSTFTVLLPRKQAA